MYEEVAMKPWLSSSMLIAVLFLNSCTSPDIQLLEVDSKTVSSTETIHMNNCGGMDSSEQTAQQNFATGLELDQQNQVDYTTIENMIAGKYGLYKDTVKSLLLKTPPGTNMEFSLKWSEDVYTGNISAGETIGAYVVHVPLSVELVSSRDLGCISIEPISTDSHIRETLTVSFKDGATGVSTENHYSGLVTMIVQGTGQAGGTARSDAFYVFTDNNGENIEPIHPKDFYNFTLWINGEPADTLVDPIPPYNADHVYEFTIKAPGGRLVFAVGDVYVVDNDGYYTVQILK
jgi:hypothetical protein